MTELVCTGNMFRFICTCARICCCHQVLSLLPEEADFYFFQLFAMNQKMAWKTTENIKGFIIEFFYST